jgi:hypothetical protein
MMKSKRKLEQTNQMSLGDLPQAVCKPQDSTTNSTAHLRAITKSETLGQIPTNKNCIYEDGEWWYVGQADGGRRRVKSHNKKNTSRMFVNGKYVPKTHPLYKAGKYKGFEEAAFSSLANYDTSPEGQVYIITNPAWDGWVKVGMAVDAMDRIKNYQTSSPFRDYTLLYAYEVNDRRAGEAAAHARLAKECDNINEWFRLPSAIANELILEVIHEY